MAKNTLTGKVPSQFGQLSSMQFMDLAGNLMTGSIATEFGLLSSLRSMNISSNDGLTGAIPVELCRRVETFPPTSEIDGYHPLEYQGLNGWHFDCSDHMCGCACGCNAV